MLITKPIRLVVKPTAVPDTRLTESAQCVYLAAAQFARKEITSDTVNRTMVRCASKVDVDMPTQDIVDKLNPVWQRSSEKIANYLRTYFKHTDYVFHRNSSTVKQIYAKFSELNKKAGKVFAQPDKWQPADIWAIRGKVDVSKIQNLDTLNRYLRDKITSGFILPISLKQTTGLKPVKLTTHNIEKQVSSTVQQVLPKFKGTQVNTGGTNWTSSKMVKINFQLEGNKQGHFEFRQSKPGADVNAEMVIRTSAARHGKIKKSVIVDAIRHAGGSIRIPDEKKINELSVNFDNQLINDTFNLAVKIEKKQSVTLDQFKDGLFAKKDLNWLASKYIGILYVDAINQLTSEKQNQFMAELYSHALVVGELAAPFLKVE